MQHIREKPLPGTQINFAHPLAKGLVGCWLMNETGQRVFDSSPYKNHGKLSGFDSPPRRSNLGVTFDGVNDYIDLGNDPGLDVQSGNFTMESIIKINSISLQAIVGKIDFIPHSWGLFQSGQYIQFQYRGVGAGIDINADSTYTIGEYYHVVVVRNGTIVRMYINGIVQVLSASSSDIPVTSSKNFYIGRRNTDLNYNFNGTIDEVRIWNRALSRQEVAQLYLNPYDIFRED